MVWMLLLVSFIFGGSGAWLMMRNGAQWGVVDQPTGRSSHGRLMPRGGGLGILGAFTLAAIFLELSPVYWGAVAIVGVVSLLDDRFGLSSRFRLTVQCIAAVAIQYPLFSGRDIELLIIYPLVALFVVGTANFYNFMDGIDGIASLNGIVAFGFVAVLAVLENNVEVAIISGCLVAACLGFLPFNFPIAKVFMGDVGSVVLGFLYAVLVVDLASTLESVLLLVGFLALFYLDTVSTLFLRWLKGDDLTKAHRQHLYQLLVHQCHLSHLHVSLGYFIVQVFVAAALLMSWLQGSLLGEITVWMVLLSIFIGLRFRVQNVGTN